MNPLISESEEEQLFNEAINIQTGEAHFDSMIMPLSATHLMQSRYKKEGFGKISKRICNPEFIPIVRMVSLVYNSENPIMAASSMDKSYYLYTNEARDYTQEEPYNFVEELVRIQRPSNIQRGVKPSLMLR